MRVEFVWLIEVQDTKHSSHLFISNRLFLYFLIIFVLSPESDRIEWRRGATSRRHRRHRCRRQTELSFFLITFIVLIH